MSEQSGQSPGPNLALLKWIVGILGVLIVIFTVVLAVTIFSRLTATDSDDTSAEMSAGAGGGKHAQIGDIRVPLPEDFDVISLTAANERLFMILGSEGVARVILIISLKNGEILGTLTLGREGIQ